MLNFYKLENGRAQVGSGKAPDNSWTIYEVGQEPNELLEALAIDTEEQRIKSIKAKAAELIRNKYPDYKQLNIIRVGGVELEEMTAYIDGIRAISNEAEESEVKVEDMQWL